MARLDKAKQFAHQLLDDASRRKADQVREASVRIEAGKATLTALLEGTPDTVSPRHATVGKLTQTLVSYAPQLTPHRGELQQVIRQIDAAQSELQRGAPVSKVAGLLEGGMTKLFERAQISREAMPRDLLGDLVNDDPAPKEPAAPDQAPTKTATRSSPTSRVYKPLENERSAKRVDVASLATATGWIDRFKPAPVVKPVAPVDEVKPSDRVAGASKSATIDTRPRAPVDRVVPNDQRVTAEQPIVGVAPNDQRATAEQPVVAPVSRATRPHEDVTPNALPPSLQLRPTPPASKPPTSPVEATPKTAVKAATKTIVPQQPARTQLDVIATSSIVAAAKQTLDIDEPEREPSLREPRTTRRALGTQTPPVTNRVAQTPLPPALQLRPPRARVTPTRAREVPVQNVATDARREARRVRDLADVKTQQRLATDRMRAQSLTNAATAPSKALLRKPTEVQPQVIAPARKPTTMPRPVPRPSLELQQQTQRPEDVPPTTKPTTMPGPSLELQQQTQRPPTPTQSTTPGPIPEPNLERRPRPPLPQALTMKPRRDPRTPVVPAREPKLVAKTAPKPTQTRMQTPEQQPVETPPPRDAKLAPTPQNLVATDATTAAPGPTLYQAELATQQERLAQIENKVERTPSPEEKTGLSDELAATQQRSKHQARHHQQHQQHRHQQGKQKAQQHRQHVDARARELARRQQAYATSARKQLADELAQSSDLALKMLDLTKEQRIEELKRRLAEQKPKLAKQIQDGKDAAAKRWESDKKDLAKAHTDATSKISTDCDAALVQTTNDFKVMRRQLQTNPEQAALTALAQSKRDQERFEQTKKTNIKTISTTAQTTLTALHQRVAAATAAVGKKDEAGKATPEAETAGKMIGQLLVQIGQVVADEAKDIAAETTKYDGLIARRKEAGDNAARDIRTDAKGYLASLDAKEAQAKREVERLREEGKQLADDRYTHDVERIQHELDAELGLLDAQRVNAEIEADQAINLAIEDTTEMTEADKANARADITKRRADGLREIQRASADKLGEMTELVAKSRDAIDKNLAGLGEKTVVAQHTIAALETEFARRVDQTRQKLEGLTNRAIVAQQKTAAATQAGLRTLRSGRYDRPEDRKWGDVSRELMDERADFAKQKDQEQRYDKQRQDELDHLKTYEDPEGRRNLKPEQEPWTEATRQKKAQELMRALVGGVGDKDVKGRLTYDYNAIRLAFATMTPDQIHDLLDHNPEIKELFGRGNGADKLCLDQVINAKDPTEMRAALLNWSTNGALGNDKTANAVGALVSPIGYLWTAGGYDKATMEAMFNSMSPEEKKQLDALYKDKYGLSVIDEIKDETYSVANRDELFASWSSDPAEKLRLQAQNSQLSGTYGNILGTIKNAGYLVGYDVTNEQAMRVFAAPQELVAWGLDSITGGTARQDQLRQLESKELDMMIDPNQLMTAQRDYLKAMAPLPTDSPVEKLRKKQQLEQTVANLRVADGRSLAELDDAAANNAYQKLWGGNQQMTSAFEALRKGDEERFMRERMLAGLKQHLGSETWIKEGIEDAAKRGKMAELKQLLADQGTSYDQLVEKRFRPWFGDHDNVDATYFKVLGEEPADPKQNPDAYARQTAAKLAYYQLGGITGFGNDTASIEKELANMPKELKDQIAAKYKDIVKDQTTFLPTWLSELTNPLGNWSTGDVWQDLELTYGGEWSRWSGGWLGGKGADWAKVKYDIDNGKATTPEEQYRRALARYQIDMSNTDNMSPLIVAQAKRELERMQDAYERLPPSLRTADLDTLGPAQREQLADVNMHMALANGWQDTGNATQVSYVETVGWVIGTAVATVIIVAGTVLTDGALAAVLVPVAAAVIGGLTTMGVKRVMLGDKYSGTALQQDFANMVIDAVMAGVIGAGEVGEFADKLVKGLGVEDKVAQMILRELISNAENIPGGLAHALNNPEVWKGDSAEVLAKLGSIAKTEVTRAIVTTGAAVVTRSTLNIPFEGATKLQSTVLETIKGGSAAVVDLDPSQPMGDQVLNVFKAAAVSGIQTFAKGTAEEIRASRKASTALTTTEKPSSSSIAVDKDGTVVMAKETYAEQLREMRRAAEANGDKVSWKQRPTVDEHGRMVIDVQVGDKRVVVAVGGGEAKPLTTSEEPKQITDGNPQNQLATSEAPRQLATSDELTLKDIAARPISKADEVQLTLTGAGLTRRADELRAQHPELAKLGRGELEALISMQYAEGRDVDRGLAKQGTLQLQKDAEVYGRLASKALEALPSEAGVFRKKVDLDDAQWSDVTPGAVIRDPAYTHVSSDKAGYVSPGKTEIVIEGFNGKRTDFLMKRGSGEGPVMFDRNTPFEVVSVAPDRSQIVLRELSTWNKSMVENAETRPWKNSTYEMNHAGIDAVDQHLNALGKIWPEQEVMLKRLRAITDGKLEGTQRDRFWYLHESFELRDRARRMAETPQLDLKVAQNQAHYRTIRAMGGIGDNPYDLLVPEAQRAMMKREAGFKSKQYTGEDSRYELDYEANTTTIPANQMDWEEQP